MVEEWRDIPGYEGLYAVSNLGNIKSLKRFVNVSTRNRIIKEKLLTPTPGHYGYLFVNLSKSGIHRVYYVHKIVAEVFIPNPDMFPIVKHKDGNKQNNSVDNLEWYNAKQGYKKPKSVVQLDLDGNIINEFQSVGKASQITGITRDNISRVCNGIRNTAGGYKWKYKKVVK